MSLSLESSKNWVAGVKTSTNDIKRGQLAPFFVKYVKVLCISSILLKTACVTLRTPLYLYQQNKATMERIKYTYIVKGLETTVVAGETWDGQFFMEWKTPNGYPRANYYGTAEECMKAFNRRTNNQTK